MEWGAPSPALEATTLFPSRTGFLIPKTDIRGKNVKKSEE